MRGNRVLNTKRNIVSGLIKQITNIVLPFATRTVFLYLLGAEYQGLNGLFTSVLHVLNLADFGFSSAVIFVLYKPIAEDDRESICALTAYLKRVYFIVGIAMLAIGCALIPFLKFIIADGCPPDINMYVIYLIYLVNNSLSYLLFGYKSAVLTAMQREDIVSNVATLGSLFLRIGQILVLLISGSFYLYSFVLLIKTILNNILIEKASRRLFKDIVPIGKVDKETMKIINKQVKALFIDKVCDFARNSLDNIVISSLFGLIMVAIYDNYYYVYSSLYAIMLMISSAMQASIGDSLASESIEKNYNDLNRFNTIYMLIVGWFSICMAVLYQPFMAIWMNNRAEMLLPTGIMLLYCIYFYLINMNNIRNLYIEGKGLYWECRVWYVVEAIANLVLNIVLGKLLGIAGILLATILTIFFFNFVIRTNILFKSYFKISPKSFYIDSFKMLAITAVVGMLFYILCGFITFDGVWELCLKGIVCCLIPFVFYIIYRKNEYFRQGLNLIFNLKKG